jgi:hypothetical protein
MGSGPPLSHAIGVAHLIGFILNIVKQPTKLYVTILDVFGCDCSYADISKPVTVSPNSAFKVD